MLIFFLAIAAPFALMALYQYLDTERLMRSDPEPSVRPQVVVLAIIVAVTIASVSYRLLMGWQLGQTAALFIGIPALLAMSIVFVPARSATGVAFKAVTIGLLVSMIFLQEGVLCVLI